MMILGNVRREDMKNILCFGDSNTWGYNPSTKERYTWGIRWTSIIQEMLGKDEVRIVEEGLCGRTTVYEDAVRPNRKGIETLRTIFHTKNDIHSVILMLGTNDCKKYYNNSAIDISEGISQCLDIILQHVASKHVLLVSPITLGENVWKEEFDPEFDRESVLVSKYLKNEYQKVAKEKKVHFLAASEYARPSEADQEHLDVVGHNQLANAIYERIHLVNL